MFAAFCFVYIRSVLEQDMHASCVMPSLLRYLLPRQSGRTSLIEASLSNNKKVVQILVERGADIDVQDVVSLSQRGELSHRFM